LRENPIETTESIQNGNFEGLYEKPTPPAFSASFFVIENIFPIQHTNSFNCDKIFIAYPKL
jgi:hypothetical protein